MSSVTISPFAFILNDVNKQRELARKIVADIQGIDEDLEKLEGGKDTAGVARNLQRHRDSLLQIAKELGSNAKVTSSTAIDVISFVTSRSS